MMENTNHIIENRIGDIVELITEDYEKGRAIDKSDLYNKPDKAEILKILQKIMGIIYPGYFRETLYKIYSERNYLSTIIEDVVFNLNKQIQIVLKYTNALPDITDDGLNEYGQNLCLEFLKTIPKIREYLDTDIEATLQGDPAATSKDEIILSYPGLYAITVYRIANELFKLKVPMIPRIMTEAAHNKTGIDIHPGATIGKYFFIDHGTGIVIGETTEIGEHVKVYQGVTLGALSTQGGQSLRDVKRHPTIKDRVTIYSGASILGGKTVIEEDVVIGGNVFITKSVQRGVTVSVKNQELQFSEASF